MKHAPAGYDCPFCNLARTLQDPPVDPAIVLVEPRVFAFVPLHHYAGIRGNCLIVPRAHHENALDIPDDLGQDFFRATRLVANALRATFGCDGISTRQHNGPAGNQDVWHFHLHVFPRFPDDRLYQGEAALYDPAERMDIAKRLRSALHDQSRVV